ncbi:MAG TPA: hypothetical protein PK760_02980 [Flavobacteriales bacterium]|nr:hypothetical protein [Flavobacteriales bacterium]
MFDNILSQLTEQALPKLMNEHGLTKEQAHASIASAAQSAQGTIAGDHGFGMDTLLNLFSSEQNNGQANDLLSRIGDSMHGGITNSGLDPAKAAGVKDTLLPMITDMVSKHVGGNAGNLQGLLGNLGNGGGLADMAKGVLGNLFK